MDILTRKTLPAETLPGRIITRCVGRDSPSESHRMTVGFARYCAKTGQMTPHRHAEETVVVLKARRARVRCGASRECADRTEPLKSGAVLHFPEMEWHVFEYDEGGYLEIVFIYGQTENIRPEETESRQL